MIIQRTCRNIYNIKLGDSPKYLFGTKTEGIRYSILFCTILTKKKKKTRLSVFVPWQNRTNNTKI